MAHTPNLRYVDPYEPRGPLYRAVSRFSATRPGAWLPVNLAWKIDPRLLPFTRGRLSTAWPVRAALLESRGARTGQPRRNATLYFHDGDRVTIAASLRGWPRNPAWYHNLRRHPDAIFGGLPFRAEIVEDQAERERLWDLADRVYPQYADFRDRARKAGRVIPIIQLVPRRPKWALYLNLADVDGGRCARSLRRIHLLEDSARIAHLLLRLEVPDEDGGSLRFVDRAGHQLGRSSHADL